MPEYFTSYRLNTFYVSWEVNKASESPFFYVGSRLRIRLDVWAICQAGVNGQLVKSTADPMSRANYV